MKVGKVGNVGKAGGQGVQIARRLMRGAVSALALCVPGGLPAQQPPAAENVVLIMIDGVRWQEIFSGAERALLTREHGVRR